MWSHKFELYTTTETLHLRFFSQRQPPKNITLNGNRKIYLNQNCMTLGLFAVCFRECNWFWPWLWPFHPITHCITILPGPLDQKENPVKDCKKINKKYRHRPQEKAQLNGCMIRILIPLQPRTKDDVSGMCCNNKTKQQKQTATYQTFKDRPTSHH